MEVAEFGETPVVLDGGLATELEARGHDLSDDLWSARLLIEQPEEILEAHAAFFAAGAAIATTASYQASFANFAARGIERNEAAALLRRSVDLGKQARDRMEHPHLPRWVAASVGPYGAVLADGSEYRGRYGLSVAELVKFHRPRMEALVDAQPDLLALETVPDVDEAVALSEAVTGLGVPAWLSYTIQGDRTRAGQSLEEAFSVAADNAAIIAVGVNCCAPDDVAPAIAAARRVTRKPVIAYPNSGEGWDAQRRSWTGPAHSPARYAAQWLSAGAHVLGGCCRVGPDSIAELSAALGTSD